MATRRAATNYRNRRAGSRHLARRCRPATRRWPGHRGFFGQARADRQLCPAIRASLRAPAGSARSKRRSGPRDRRDRALLAELGRALRPPDRLARGGAPVALDPACAEPSGHRRHDRGTDHLAAGNPGWQSQLGLSLQLAAQLDLHPVRAAQCRLQGRGSRLARLAAASCLRGAGANAHGLSVRRRPPLWRTQGHLVAGL